MFPQPFNAHRVVAIISRQFRDIPRARIEGLLATFPKIRPTTAQHTMCETDAVRYLYRALDDHHFLVLLTNTSSNILQDLNTLQLFVRVFSDVCPPKGGSSAGGWSKSDIKEHAFDLAEAFDECVSPGGYREHVNAQQVAQILEMDSHEERIQEIIAKNKEKEVKEEGKRRAKELDAQRREQQRKGISSGVMGSSPITSASSFRPSENVMVADYERRPSPAPVAAPIKGKGMQLGKKKSTVNTEFLVSSGITDDYVPRDYNEAVTEHRIEEPKSSEPTREPVHIEVEERIQAVAKRDGGLDAFECRGSLVLHVADANLNRIRINIDTSNIVDENEVTFKLHPNVDKKVWASNRSIQLKDPSRGFPLDTALALVKWRQVGKDETSLPIIINCWPQLSSSGECNVNVEYELEHDRFELDEVLIQIPIPYILTIRVFNIV